MRRAQSRRIRAAILLGRPIQDEDRARALGWASTIGSELHWGIVSAVGIIGLLPVGVALLRSVWFVVAWGVAAAIFGYGLIFALRLRRWGKAQGRQEAADE